jgi:penicillin-binding protein 2
VDKADFDQLLQDEACPLLNRALQNYPPGSAFKPLVALAGLEMGLGQQHYTCHQTVKIGDRNFPCWVVQKAMEGHGDLDLSGALKCSCNCYFYELGLKVGAERMASMGERFGMNFPADFALGKNASGHIPTSAWCAAHSKEPLTRSDLANMSIGQGRVTWTPLHAAMLVSTLANGGSIWNTQAVLEKNHLHQPSELRSDLVKTGIHSADLELVRQGMKDVVNSAGGTGRASRSEVFTIAGKTSTAQFYRNGLKDNITSFLGFAPYEAPSLAVVVFVHGGLSGGSTCAPIAKRILEESQTVRQGLSLPASAVVSATQPVAGHFHPVEAVDYGQKP